MPDSHPINLNLKRLWTGMMGTLWIVWRLFWPGLSKLMVYPQTGFEVQLVSTSRISMFSPAPFSQGSVLAPGRKVSPGLGSLVRQSYVLHCPWIQTWLLGFPLQRFGAKACFSELNTLTFLCNPEETLNVQHEETEPCEQILWAPNPKPLKPLGVFTLSKVLAQVFNTHRCLG